MIEGVFRTPYGMLCYTVTSGNRVVVTTDNRRDSERQGERNIEHRGSEFKARVAMTLGVDGWEFATGDDGKWAIERSKPKNYNDTPPPSYAQAIKVAILSAWVEFENENKHLKVEAEERRLWDIVASAKSKVGRIETELRKAKDELADAEQAYVLAVGLDPTKTGHAHIGA